MDYDESVIDGILHYRTTPDGKWKSFSLVSMTDKYISDQLLINNFRSQVDQFIADGHQENNKIGHIEQLIKQMQGVDISIRGNYVRYTTLQEVLQLLKG